MTLPGPGGQRVTPASSLCTRVFGPSSDKEESTGISGVSVKVDLPSCVQPTPVQPWGSSLLRSQGSDSIPCPGGGRELIRHFFFFSFNILLMVCLHMVNLQFCACPSEQWTT